MKLTYRSAIRWHFLTKCLVTAKWTLNVFLMFPNQVYHAWDLANNSCGFAKQCKRHSSNRTCPDDKTGPHHTLPSVMVRWSFEEMGRCQRLHIKGSACSNLTHAFSFGRHLVKHKSACLQFSKVHKNLNIAQCLPQRCGMLHICTRYVIVAAVGNLWCGLCNINCNFQCVKRISFGVTRIFRKTYVETYIFKVHTCGGFLTDRNEMHLIRHSV